MPVSLVLPCYNPQPGWADVVRSGFLSFGQSIGEDIELIIVFDGRSDTVTKEAVAQLERELPALKIISYEGNRGKGYATRKGVAAATADIIIYTDVDFPYTPQSMYDVYNQLKRNECDVAIGVKDDNYYGHVPVLRRVISHVLRFFIRLFLSMPVTDTQCGLKGFRRVAVKAFLATTIDRYLFDLEFVHQCFRSNNIV